MKRSTILWRIAVLAAAWSSGASAQVAPVNPAGATATTLPAVAPARTPATRPAPEELHNQAVSLMRQNQHRKAQPLFDQIGLAIGPKDRNRPVVLNRAIVDVTLKVNAMRAVRELGDYLKAHRAMDEKATDILGAALNLTARNETLKQGAIWQGAFKEWDRRNYTLDHARAGYHRWGAKWIDEYAYAELRDRQKAQLDLIDERSELVDRASWRTGSAQMRRDEAWADVVYARNAVVDDNYLTPRQRALGRQRAGRPNATTDGVNVTDRGIFANTQSDEYGIATAAWRRAESELATAKAEESSLRQDLAKLQGKVPKPDWPTTFEPVDPSEVNAPPLPPPDPKAAAAAAKDEQTLRGWPELSKPAKQGNPPAGLGGATTQPAAAAPIASGQTPAAATTAPADATPPEQPAPGQPTAASPFEQSGFIGAKPPPGARPPAR